MIEAGFSLTSHASLKFHLLSADYASRIFVIELGKLFDMLDKSHVAFIRSLHTQMILDFFFVKFAV